MNDRHGQCHKPLHGPAVCGHIGFGQLVEKRSVIDRVAGKQRPCLFLPQADAARGMAGKVQHLEMPVPDGDDVSLIDDAGRTCRLDPVGPGIVAGMGERIDEAVRQRVAGILQAIHDLRIHVFPEEGQAVVTVLHDGGLLA